MSLSSPSQPNTAPSILVIDDEPDLRILYEMSLAREGYAVVTADSVTHALAALNQRRFDVVVSDMRLPDGLGLDVLKFLSSEQRSERCIVITAYGSAENAVEALKAGAFDYLSKPIDVKLFRHAVAQAVRLGDKSLKEGGAASSEEALQASAAQREDGQEQPQALQAIVGHSQVMVQLRERVRRVARSMAPVLVRGESGVGKELVARAIHACSHRADGPFVAVNCGAIPDNLLEAEFFGARKGSYTGAAADRVGFFQAAQDGTLFLDEIGELPMSMQVKLLRAIQERMIRPIGDTQEVSVNARIVSATHRDLNQAVTSGAFRQDLYYRINVIDVQVPALRERLEDLPLLVAHLLERIAKASGQSAPTASPEFLHQLAALPLSGNIRELENLLHRAMALADGKSLLLESSQEAMIDAPALPTKADALASARQSVTRGAPSASNELPSDLQAHLDAQERNILIQALKESEFNRTLAAERLGISLRQIRYRMARLDIHEDEVKQ